MHVTYTDVMLMQKLQSTPLLFFRWRACKLGLALVIAITAHATYLLAEDQPPPPATPNNANVEGAVSPSVQGEVRAVERAADAEGYVWVDKDGKTVISNLPRDAEGAPMTDSAAVQSGTENAVESRKGFYQWTDEKGVTHLTDRLAKVPAERRNTVVVQPLPEGNFFDIELSPAVRALLRSEQRAKRWMVFAGAGVLALLVFFVLWRRNRKLRPDPAVFAKRAIDGETGADGASATNGAPLNPEAKLAAHYKLIGVAPEALSSEVRKAYHRRMGEYHPDKVVGLGQELRLLAEAKSREINEAYEAILFSRGED